MTKPAHAPAYEVTRDGRVFSVRGTERREMTQEPNDHGYPSVRIVIDGKRRRMTVHRLVAAQYLPARPSPSHEIRHLDGNRTNNCADNLSWGTRKENAADRARHGRTSCGPRHSAAIKAGFRKNRDGAHV